MNRRILHERTYRGSMLQPEIDLRSTENARKRQNGKLSAWGSHLGHWGKLRRRGLIAGRGELELGLPGTATTSDIERRWFLLAARSTQSSRRWSLQRLPELLDSTDQLVEVRWPGLRREELAVAVRRDGTRASMPRKGRHAEGSCSGELSRRRRGALAGVTRWGDERLAGASHAGG